MEIHRFALGIRFDPVDASIGVDEVSFALSTLLSQVPKRNLSGMELYAGHFRLDEYDDPSCLTVVTMGEGMKKTKALYNAVCDSPILLSMLTEHRPIVLTNAIARMSGLSYYGRFDKKGALSGGEKQLELFEALAAKRSSRRSIRPVFILAPDKFKGTFDQEQVIKILKASARCAFPGCTFISLPMADGGDGTGRILAKAMNAVRREASVLNAYGETVTAELYLTASDTAIVEMASASGLANLECTPDPLKASSFGSGELIKAALDNGAKKLIVCLGGSATNDGGIGAAAALGVRFFDISGCELDAVPENMGSIASIDLDSVEERIKNCEIIVICDVTNPLCGEKGATYTFGPQKGADEAALIKLEAGMKNLEKLYNAVAGRLVCSEQGSGAAGGMGAMLAALFGAKLKSGAETVLDEIRFDETLLNAKRSFAGRSIFAITGEGKLDKTSSEGKAVGAVAEHCEKNEIPCFIVCGSSDPEYSSCFRSARVFSASDPGESAESIIKNAEKNLRNAADSAFAFIRDSLSK